MSENWKNRLLTEYAYQKSNISKLEKAIDTLSIDPIDLQLLEDQLDAQQHYVRILELRIARAKLEIPEPEDSILVLRSEALAEAKAGFELSLLDRGGVDNWDGHGESLHPDNPEDVFDDFDTGCEELEAIYKAF